MFIWCFPLSMTAFSRFLAALDDKRSRLGGEGRKIRMKLQLWSLVFFYQFACHLSLACLPTKPQICLVTGQAMTNAWRISIWDITKATGKTRETWTTGRERGKEKGNVIGIRNYIYWLRQLKKRGKKEKSSLKSTDRSSVVYHKIWRSHQGRTAIWLQR